MHFSLPFFILISTSAALVLPDPAGPYQVALRVHALTDESRQDPYAPSNAPHKRKVLISTFWPVEEECCSKEIEPYMPPATAEYYGQVAASMGLSNETFENFQLDVCNISDNNSCDSRHKSTRYPLAIFSPGAGDSRLLYSAMAKAVASNGYVVVTVDHPYDAEIVEFPDGTIILGADIPENKTVLEMATKVRAEDVSFVLSQFEDKESRDKMIKDLPGSIDLKKVAAWGHSLGGATAAGAMLIDKRILGGVDLDGQLFDPALSRGLDKPFFLLGRPDHRKEDVSWVQFWHNLRGSKVEMEVSGALHGSFTDLPLLLNLLDLPSKYQSVVESLVGTVKGVQLVADTVSQFFTFVFEGDSGPLLNAAKNSTDLVLVAKHEISRRDFCPIH